MIRPLQQLIDALRDELLHCGELLAWLDTQPRLTADGGLALAPHAHALLAAQQLRERSQVQLAWAAEQPDASSLGELLPILPPAYQPLVGALIEEITSLWHRVGARLSDDLCWLGRAREISGDFLENFPDLRAMTAEANHPGTEPVSLSLLSA
jgi:hypothetical protein